MEKSILIIECVESVKLSEELIKACESQGISGLNFKIAKTQDAADMLLASDKSISAVIYPKDKGFAYHILDNTQDYQTLASLMQHIRAETFKALTPTDRVVGDVFYQSSDLAEKEHQDLVKANEKKFGSRDDLSEILITLKSFGLLSNDKNFCHCHFDNQEAILDCKYKIKSLTDDLEKACKSLRSIETEISNCPLKRNLVDSSKPAGDGASKSIIIAIVTLFGTIITGVFLFLGEIFKALAPLMDKLFK